MIYDNIYEIHSVGCRFPLAFTNDKKQAESLLEFLKKQYKNQYYIKVVTL